jgi:hypothetical protein
MPAAWSEWRHPLERTAKANIVPGELIKLSDCLHSGLGTDRAPEGHRLRRLDRPNEPTCRTSSPTPFEADAVPHNSRYKQKNRHHCQDNSDIPP